MGNIEHGSVAWGTFHFVLIRALLILATHKHTDSLPGEQHGSSETPTSDVCDGFQRSTDSCKYLQYTIRHIRFGNSGACSDCRATGSLKLSIRFVFCGKTTSKIVMDLTNTAELLRNPHSRGTVTSDQRKLSSISYAPCKSIIL